MPIRTLRPLSPGRHAGFVLALLLSLGMAGCGGDQGAEGVPGEAGPMGEPRVFATDDGLLRFTLPERWGDEVTIRESTPAELEWSPPAPERVFQFILAPRDSRFAGENLFNLFVYDPEVWEGAAPRAGEIGQEVARRDDLVYVMSRPEENPYPEGSVDHGRFERFAVSVDEVREALLGG
jgi:hypothetical protein